MPENTSVLYHASPIQGLVQLQPRVGTHGQPWVYATPDIVIASLFLGRLGGDLTCGVGTVGGHPYLREKFCGAFELRYGTGSASLYVVPATDFAAGKTSWKQDWVCEQPVVPLQEIQIDNVRSHLLGLVTEGRLNLHRYPESRMDVAEETKLVQNFARLYHSRGGGDKVFEHVRLYYLHLLERVRAAAR
jgi:hypothetical protein